MTTRLTTMATISSIREKPRLRSIVGLSGKPDPISKGLCPFVHSAFIPADGDLENAIVYRTDARVIGKSGQVVTPGRMPVRLPARNIRVTGAGQRPAAAFHLRPKPLLGILGRQGSDGALVGDMGTLQRVQLHGGGTQHADGEHQQGDQRLDQGEAPAPVESFSSHQSLPLLPTRPWRDTSSTRSSMPSLDELSVIRQSSGQPLPATGLPKASKVNDSSAGDTCVPAPCRLRSTVSSAAVTR